MKQFTQDIQQYNSLFVICGLKLVLFHVSLLSASTMQQQQQKQQYNSR